MAYEGLGCMYFMLTSWTRQVIAGMDTGDQGYNRASKIRRSNGQIHPLEWNERLQQESANEAHDACLAGVSRRSDAGWATEGFRRQERCRVKMMIGRRGERARPTVVVGGQEKRDGQIVKRERTDENIAHCKGSGAAAVSRCGSHGRWPAWPGRGTQSHTT